MFNYLMKKFVTPYLKKNEFKRKGLTWNKEKNGLIHVINFQLSRFNDRNSECFTINVGIFDPSIWHRVWEKKLPKFVNEEECFPRFRIGQLINDFSSSGTDQWWTCELKTNLNELGTEIIGILENVCLPFFRNIHDYQSIDSLYCSKSIRLFPIENIYLAIVKKNIGKIKECDDLLREISIISSAWDKRVMFVRSKL